MVDAADRAPIERVLVLVPTYDERENLPVIVERIRSAVPDADILVLDDNSPDGTGQLADEMAAADAHVHVMHRRGKEGLGKAYLAGFAWGLERGYDAQERDQGAERRAPTRDTRCPTTSPSNARTVAPAPATGGARPVRAAVRDPSRRRRAAPR